MKFEYLPYSIDLSHDSTWTFSYIWESGLPTIISDGNNLADLIAELENEYKKISAIRPNGEFAINLRKLKAMIIESCTYFI